MTVTSTLGNGSTFTCELPLRPAHGETKEQTVEMLDGGIDLCLPPGPVREAVELVLADCGLHGIAVPPQGGASAMRAVVCIADHLDAALANVALRSTPVLLLSRLGDTRANLLLANGQVAGVLEMPFATRDLREALKALLSGRRADVSYPVNAQSSAHVVLPFTGLRVLAADDSAINREVLMEALNRLGASVTCVEDGAAALEAIKASTFDVVFMDGSMPLLDGYEATRALRAWEQQTHRDPLPIIGLSAHVIGDRATNWRDCGMSDFITKPFTLAAIRNCLERWCTKGTASQDNAASASSTTHGEPEAHLSPLLDASVLQSIAEMQRPGDDLIARVTGLYIGHAPALLSKLQEWNSASRDLSQLAAAAHALKSLSRNVGAVRVGDICGIVEDAARDGRDEVDTYREALSEALSQTVDHLRKGLNTTGSAAVIASKSARS